jgi:hypothetical protein
MLSRLSRRLTYANVVATLALIVAVGTGSAYAANTVFSTDIVDGQVKSVDIGDGEIKSADVKDESLTTFDISTMLGADVVDETLTGADIKNGSLTANDVSENSFNVAVNVGDVPPHGCTYAPINGVAAEGDHMVLTPNYSDSFQNLSYGIEYRNGTDTAELKACNPTDTVRGDGTTHFNLLVFQH